MKTDYDVCIIGSGAGGGMAAYVLTQAGANVILLEAGGPWDSRTDSAMLTWPYESPRRGAATSELRRPSEQGRRTQGTGRPL